MDHIIYMNVHLYTTACTHVFHNVKQLGPLQFSSQILIFPLLFK